MLWNDDWLTLRSSNKKYEAKSVCCFPGFCMFCRFLFPSNLWPQHTPPTTLRLDGTPKHLPGWQRTWRARHRTRPRLLPGCDSKSASVEMVGWLQFVQLCAMNLWYRVVQYDDTTYIIYILYYNACIINNWLGFFIRMMIIHMVWIPSQKCQCLWTQFCRLGQ